MSLSTRNKRAAAIMPGLFWRNLLPLPDGTINSSDRAQVAGYYPTVIWFPIQPGAAGNWTPVVTS